MLIKNIFILIAFALVLAWLIQKPIEPTGAPTEEPVVENLGAVAPPTSSDEFMSL